MPTSVPPSLGPEGIFSYGPFLGLDEKEATRFLSQYDPKRCSAELKEEAFRILSEGRTVNDLVRMWGWMDSKELGVQPMGPHLHGEQLQLGDYIEECRREDKGCFIVILKARQLGCSTYVQNVLELLASVEPYNHFLTVADIQKKVAGLASKARFTYNSLRTRVGYYPRARFNRNGAEFENGSTLEIASAEEDEPGRSFSYNGNHLSESAFYSRDMQVIASTSATLKKTGFRLVVQESTANGAGGQFYSVFNAATDPLGPRNQYRAFFFPWHEHASYRMRVTQEQADAIWKSLDEEEKEGVDQFGWDVEQLAWRRQEIHTMLSGDLDKFHQEYPATAIEAFIQGGRPVFDRKAMLYLSRTLQRVEPVFEGDIV